MSERMVIIRPGLTAEKGLIIPGKEGTLRVSVVLNGLIEIELEPAEIDALHALSLANGDDMANWLEVTLQPE